MHRLFPILATLSALSLASCAPDSGDRDGFLDEAAAADGWTLAIDGAALGIWTDSTLYEQVWVEQSAGAAGALLISPTTAAQLELEVIAPLAELRLLVPGIAPDQLQAELDGTPIPLIAAGSASLLSLSEPAVGVYTLSLRSTVPLDELGVVSFAGDEPLALSALVERGVPQGVISVASDDTCPTQRWAAPLDETADWLAHCMIAAPHGDRDSDSAMMPPPVAPVDADGDGISSASDCDDSDASVGGPQTWWYDADYDFFGDPAVAYTGCTRPFRYRTNDLDCDDSDASVAGPQTWWYDADYDFFGDPAVAYTGCTRPSRYRTNDLDCDDSDASVGGPQTWWYDADYDFFGDPAVAHTGCTRPSRYRTNNLDCDDTSAATNPRAVEVVDGVDNDCDGLTDE